MKTDTQADTWQASQLWDAVVVGGGPAGSAAAFALAKAGWRVLVVERQSKFDFKFGELLSPMAHPLLRRMGLDKARLTHDHAPARGTVSVWGSAVSQSNEFIFNPYGEGLRLDRPLFDHQLRSQAERVGAVVALGVRLVDLRRQGLWQLTFEDSAGSVEQIARFVIDCSGRHSLVSRLLGARRYRFDRLCAIGALHDPENDETDPFLRIEALSHGWLYSLQLPSAKRIVVLHTDSDLHSYHNAAEFKGLEDALAESQHIGPRLREHGYAPTCRPRGAIACGARLSAVCGPGWLAAGDAALSFDPLSSQGIFNALESGFGAADALIALDHEDDALNRYAATIDIATSDYLRNHRYYYNLETRWSDQPFWSRRQRAQHLAPAR